MYMYTYSVTSYGDIVFHFSPFISFFFILLFNFIYLFLSTFTIIYFIPSSYSLEFKHKNKTTNFLLGSCSLLSLSLSIFGEDSINQTLINMKGIDHIFCASQASTAICLSMQQDEASSSSTIHLGGRAIDRHNPIIRDARRITRALPSAPCSSEPLPINPKPYHQLPKPNNNKKSSSFSNKKSSRDKKKKSSSNSKPLAEQTNKIPSSSNNDVTIYKDCYTAMPADIKKKSCAQLGDFITPPGSSRYLLSDAAFFDGLSDYDPVLALVPETGPEKTSVLINGDDSSVAKSPSSSSRSEKSPSNQVVVLRVSLHCKGCEGKVRKHLSRMKGVSSFNIDFAAKKVTVVGDVTPLSVLASISKVKNAQFWPVTAPATSSASTSTAFPSNNKLEINK